jgi:fucose permease
MTSLSQDRRTILLAHAAFVLTGIVVTMLGPLIPILTARWTISDAAAGGLFTAQFTGSTLGVGLSSLLLPRRGFRVVLVLSLFWMALGVVALAVATWPAGIGAVFVYGVGFGIAIPTANLLVSRMYPGGDAGALNLLNMSWGIGAIAGPIAISALVSEQRVSLLFWILASLLVCCGVAVASSPIRTDDSLRSDTVTAEQSGKLRWQLAALFGVLFFVYVGSENAFSGWIATYAKRLSSTGSMWALTPSFFWLMLVSGRGLAPLALRRFSSRTVANAGLVLACIGTTALLASHQLWTSVLSALIAGLGFAPVYPIMISGLSRRFGDQARRIAGFTFAMAGMGGAVLPWVVGFVAGETGSLRLGLIVPLAGTVVMFVLQLAEGTKAETS